MEDTILLKKAIYDICIAQYTCLSSHYIQRSVLFHIKDEICQYFNVWGFMTLPLLRDLNDYELMILTPLITDLNNATQSLNTLKILLNPILIHYLYKPDSSRVIYIQEHRCIQLH
jgi:hypothetical protein